MKEKLTDDICRRTQHIHTVSLSLRTTKYLVTTVSRTENPHTHTLINYTAQIDVCSIREKN